ncbi:calmodulin-binding protein 25 [Diospyros lotus]|uniref:calmodulin-binding protein 25 n=1 Tax=Diospyros lotus TaxID=55363 RepID=UPI00224CEA2C|nr:calmodulin-binding protein 25 [Diospyros lotus]
MASSNSLGSSGGSLEPWAFRSGPLADSWVLEALARDTEASFTKALQDSITGSQAQAVAAAPVFSAFGGATGSPRGSASDAEGMGSKRRRSDTDTPVSGAKRTKRKSKRSSTTTTTFIAADPTNFRQMVQQVTGVRFGGNAPEQVAPPMVVKPEPQRPAAKRVLNGSYCLPTLDTSAFVLDHHQQYEYEYQYQYQQPQVTKGEAPSEVVGATEGDQAILLADGGIGFDFDSFSSFPTLESGRVM